MSEEVKCVVLSHLLFYNPVFRTEEKQTNMFLFVVWWHHFALARACECMCACASVLERRVSVVSRRRSLWEVSGFLLSEILFNSQNAILMLRYLSRLPGIFPGAPLKINGAPVNIKRNLKGMNLRYFQDRQHELAWSIVSIRKIPTLMAL